MAQYLSLADARDLYGIPTDDTESDAGINKTLQRATALIDAWTHAWWDKRTVTIRTRAITDRQRKLFLPAHVITITSVKEDGVALLPDEFIVGPSWLEKPSSFWFHGFETVVGVSIKPGIEIIGDLGWKRNLTVVPEEIQAAVGEIANIMGGWRKRTIIQDDGIERTVLLTDLPDWVQDIIFSHKLGRLRQQDFIIE